MMVRQVAFKCTLCGHIKEGFHPPHMPCPECDDMRESTNVTADELDQRCREIRKNAKEKHG